MDNFNGQKWTPEMDTELAKITQTQNCKVVFVEPKEAPWYKQIIQYLSGKKYWRY